MSDVDSDFVHLARLALDGSTRDVAALARRTLRTIIRKRPDLAEQATSVLARAASGAPTRAASSDPLPVDLDSRLELLRREVAPVLPIEPTWPPVVAEHLEAVVQERAREQELVGVGLAPTRSMLFVGPPGVGKTLAAKWLALRLARPLLTLDLAAVMSSFLGRTGNNIRVVLDYARRSPSVLLLDEFDAIAKRRDDSAEIGELKRLVTVLLQTIEEWPASGVLVAATNHPELLDPAVWRRFDRVVVFPNPDASQMKEAILRLLELEDLKAMEPQALMLASLFAGATFADMTRHLVAARRDAIMQGLSVTTVLGALAYRLAHDAPLEQKLEIARELARNGYSQRGISEATGLSRDTIRKHRVGGRPREGQREER